jgi:hypothetical protein
MPKPERDNQIYVEVRLNGHVFRMTLGIPDAPGQVSATDLRDDWIRPKVSGALKNIFGKIVEVF